MYSLKYVIYSLVMYCNQCMVKVLQTHLAFEQLYHLRNSPYIFFELWIMNLVSSSSLKTAFSNFCDLFYDLVTYLTLFKKMFISISTTNCSYMRNQYIQSKLVEYREFLRVN